MILIFELIYSLLPIGGENITIMAMKSLGNLKIHQYVCFKAGNRGGIEFSFFSGGENTFEKGPLYISGAGTEEDATSAALAPYCTPSNHQHFSARNTSLGR